MVSTVSRFVKNASSSPTGTALTVIVTVDLVRTAVLVGDRVFEAGFAEEIGGRLECDFAGGIVVSKHVPSVPVSSIGGYFKCVSIGVRVVIQQFRLDVDFERLVVVHIERVRRSHRKRINHDRDRGGVFLFAVGRSCTSNVVLAGENRRPG